MARNPAHTCHCEGVRHCQRQATQGVSCEFCILIEQVTVNTGLDEQESDKNSDAHGQEEAEFRGLKVGFKISQSEPVSFWKLRIISVIK